MAAALKTLFSGAVDGGVEPLLKKVDAINKKSGPFDLLFCVGQFFGGWQRLAGQGDRWCHHQSHATRLGGGAMAAGRVGARLAGLAIEAITEALTGQGVCVVRRGIKGVAGQRGGEVAGLLSTLTAARPADEVRRRNEGPGSGATPPKPHGCR